MPTPLSITIDAPEIAPQQGGILSAAPVHVTPVTGYELYYGVQYINILEGKNRPVPTDSSDKIFDKIEATNSSVQFAVYRGVDVSLMRWHSEGPKLVQAAFESSESYGVETNVQSKVLNPKAVQLNGPGAVTSVRLALGLLQQYARDNFSGAPLITGNALALTIIEDALEGSGTDLTTKLGVPVVLAGGYGAAGPGAVNAAAGQAWLYISGPINIWRGPVEVHEGPNLKDNREYSLAEAQYAASVDGPVAAILIGT